MAGKYQAPTRRRRARRRSPAAALLALLAAGILVVLAIVYGPKLLAGRQAATQPGATDPPTTQAPTETQVPVESLAPTQMPTQAPTEPPVPWNLTLVNAAHPLPEDWTIELTTLRNGTQVDSRIYPDLQAMFDACRAAGMSPIVNSAYRSTQDQQRILDGYIDDYLAQGYTQEDARTEALKWVARPGTSEHELGLSVDIDAESMTYEDNLEVWSWLSEHCTEYGFILRYTAAGEAYTGISPEAWHFRYVGREAAEEIQRSDITLEEYLIEWLGLYEGPLEAAA